MKTLIIFLALGLPAIAAAQPYEAAVRLEHWWWQLNGSEWEGELFADLYDDGVLVPDNASLSYKWFYKFPAWSDFLQFSTSYHILREGINTGSYRDYYVEIYQNSVLLATSEVYRVTTPPASKIVTLSGLLENTNPATGNKISIWSYPRNWHPTKEGGASGSPLPLTLNDVNTLWAYPDVLSSPVQRYHRWTRSDGPPTHINHGEFYVESPTNAITAHYRSFVTTATLRTEVIDGGSLNIEFRDPWLIDYNDPGYGNNPRNRGQAGALWYSKPSPFSPNASTNYKGVFLNQNPNTSPSYYSVRPTNQTVNGLNWFLWNGVTTNATVTQPTNSETPVVFTASNADVKARVKLRLGSSLSSATAANGQRKLVYTNTSPGKFHLVYESAGEIYYTFSTDNAATWSNEVLLSSSDGNNKYPSIAAHQNKIYVTWQRTTSTNNYTVYARRNTSGSWSARQSLGSASLTSGNNPLPVITLKEVNVGGVYKIRTLAVWKGASALRFRTSDDDGATWATEASVPNTSSTTKNPSLSAGLFFDYAYQGAYLTYDDGSLIRLATYTTSWAVTETPPGSIASYANASHVMAGAYENPNGHAHVAWQGTDPNSGTAAVFYQRKSGFDGTWSAVQSYVSSGYQRPVITHMNSGNLAMLWDNNSSAYKAIYTYSTNSWSSAQSVGTGKYPAISAAFGNAHPAASMRA